MADQRDIKAPIPNWRSAPRPKAEVLAGAYALLEPLDFRRHGTDLFRANIASDAIWDHLPYGPFANVENYCDWIGSVAPGTDPLFFAVKNRQTDHFGGVASYLRINPDAGSIEVGHINFSPELQRTRAATDALCLMIGWAFNAGYRRFEWKCDAANLPSRRAAERLGLSFEGVFRQHIMVKGCNRDTAWFAAIDGEWPDIRQAYNAWLDPGNFDANGNQITSLSELTRPILVARDPALAFGSS